MNSFGDALREINSLKEEGLLRICRGRAMTIVFWTEPVPTYDLDVLLFLPEQPARW